MELVSDEVMEPGSHDAVVEKVVDSYAGRGGFARVPLEVALDRKVKGSALRVYVVLAAALRYTGTVSIGMRLLSEKTGMKVRNVQRAIKELQDAGHLKVVPKDRGMRGCYILTSRIFHEKQGKANIKAYSQESRLIQVAVSEEHPEWPPRFDNE